MVPPLPAEESRRLRALPAYWECAVPESAVDATIERARAIASTLAGRGKRREADELRRRAAVLARADALHRHAADVETLVDLYRALATFAGEAPLALAAAREEPGHGAAFRETAALRNRAFRAVAARIASTGS
jgi:hypothetical protein